MYIRWLALTRNCLTNVLGIKFIPMTNVLGIKFIPEKINIIHKIVVLELYVMMVHDCIISLRGQVCVHQTSLTQHLIFLLKCLYQAMKVSGHVYIC
jgi:hypothetical protein